MTTKEMAGVMLAHWYDRKDVEQAFNGVAEEWHFTSAPSWDWSRYTYRVKEEPKRNPISRSDVTIGKTLFRRSEGELILLVYIEDAGLGLGVHDFKKWEILQDHKYNWKYSNDGGTTWKSCAG